MVSKRMREVDLADDGEPEVREAATVAGDDLAVDRGGAARRPEPVGADAENAWRRRPVILVAASVAVLLAGLSVFEALRTRDVAARLADLPDVLEPLEPSLHEVWRQPGGWGSTLSFRGDLIVTVDRAGNLVGTDAEIGARRWAAALPAGTNTNDIGCQVVGGADVASYVACRLTALSTGVASGPQRVSAVSDLLVVFDANTGDRVRERALASKRAVLGVVDDDLLVIDVLADGHASTTREDPATGRSRWVARSGQSLRLSDGAEAGALEVVVRRGVVTVSGPAAWALSADGETLGEWYPNQADSPAATEQRVDVTAMPGGRFVVAEPDAAYQDLPAYRVETTAGPGGFPVPGAPLEPGVDDGSAEDLLLTTSAGDGEIVALDPTTGERLWRQKRAGESDAIVLDRRLIIRVGRGLAAFDVRSGSMLWKTEAGASTNPQLFTDGRVVLVPTVDPAGAMTFLAVDPTDGRLRWSAPAPAGVIGFQALAGRLLAIRTDDVIRLG